MVVQIISDFFAATSKYFFKTPTNYKLSASKFHNESFVYFYSIFLDINFFVTSCLLPFFVFLIVKKSEKMGNYRWLLFNNIIWCFIYDAVISIGKPVLLLPIYGGYLNSFFNDLDEIFIDCLLYLFGISMIQMVNFWGKNELH